MARIFKTSHRGSRYSWNTFEKSFQLNGDVAELKNNLERNRHEVKHNKYVTSLEKELSKINSYVKQHTDELQDIQIATDNTPGKLPWSFVLFP